MKRITKIIYLALALFAIAGFALAQTVSAVAPPPDGGYPAGNTAEGTSALLNLATGTDNTALGFNALLWNMEGNYNTAVGSQSLFFNGINGAGNNNTAVGFSAMRRNTTRILQPVILRCFGTSAAAPTQPTAKTRSHLTLPAAATSP